MDHDVREVPISDFINKELILFSMADNVRSIPSVVDGFKPGQRKVLFACFKRKLKAEIKVRLFFLFRFPLRRLTFLSCSNPFAGRSTLRIRLRALRLPSR
jgi:hypothetical protein